MSVGTDGVPCMLMRGGTSKGAYFLASDLPDDPAERDELLLRIMGSPDERQIDGLGGAHPLTSKVAVVNRSESPDADVDYTFLQIGISEPTVGTAQTCGNLLAGVAPFAIERGLVDARKPVTVVRIRSMNPSIQISSATIQTPGGRVRYDGDVLLAGVPFPAAPVPLELSAPRADLYPTGRVVDTVDGVEVTCVDAGMPVVVVRAGDLGITGSESVATLEADAPLRARVEAMRRTAGELMGLGDVSNATVPKVSVVADASAGGAVATRTFIPTRVHTAIGVLMAVSVGVAVRTPGSVAFRREVGPRVALEHPSGSFAVEIDLMQHGALPTLQRSAVVRTARKIFDGVVFPRQE